MEILQNKTAALRTELEAAMPAQIHQLIRQHILYWLHLIRTIGLTEGMEDFERRKLGVFNLLNFFQLITGVLIPLIGLLHNDHLPPSAWVLACLPSSLSVAVLLFNHFHKYQSAQLSYFILYPFFTGFVYLQGMNPGVELHFVLYGVLAVFFLQDMGYMLFTIALSMVNYFILSVVLKDFIYEVKHENRLLYFFNHLLALGFIFYGLFLIKRENTGYQFRILSKQKALHRKNLEIKKQKEVITEKAELLEIQKTELTELNVLKNKLFSIIAHDLKAPMYALRNLFRNMHQQNIPAEDMKNLVPDVLTDLNYTIGLMENLLQWSKSQMQAGAVRYEEIDLSHLIRDTLQLLRLQAEAKQIRICNHARVPVLAIADKDMVNLVLRNLLSNAIKFTPPQGLIEVGASASSSFIEVYVQDSGTGITGDALKKINENSFYSTAGTASESGTGLGLMLCKEFLTKNGGQLHIESEWGKGSTFSFTLPKS